MPDAATIQGHPEEALLNEQGEVITMLTVCCECGALRSILFLSRDRWYCSACRVEGKAPPQLFPVS